MDDNIKIDLSGIETDGNTKKNTQGRDWCFTVNNPVQNEQEFLTYLKAVPDLRYAVFQREKAPETGTEHYQGYIEFTQPKWFTTIKNACQKRQSALTRILSSDAENVRKLAYTVWTRTQELVLHITRSANI